MWSSLKCWWASWWSTTDLIISNNSKALSPCLDPCKQPLGMKNGLIKSSQILTESLKNNWFKVRKGTISHCWSGSSLEINLEKEMTVTGISMSNLEIIKGIHFQHRKQNTYWIITKTDSDESMVSDWLFDRAHTKVILCFQLV